uniref:Uncharacterized protein n=1 Tax=Seriola lalandi dorsalis TaxID=1841481 RepID=A0A3B4X483_SERLL
MAIFNHLLLVSSLVPLVLSYPFYPPTCYTKVLSMARELTQDTNCYSCCQNGCVMYKMRTYISLVEGLRQRRCAYTRDVRKLGVTLRQLLIIMSEKLAPYIGFWTWFSVECHSHLSLLPVKLRCNICQI